MGDTLRLWLLGPVQAERAGEPVHGFESHKALALLCYLTMHSQPVSRSHLADLFWGDKSEVRGRGNLSRVLHNLSTLLSGLQANRHTIQFCRHAAVWLDVDAFNQLAVSGEADSLAAAVELYRGDFMAGFYLDGCPEFEAWLVMERERWQRRVVEVLQKLIDGLISRGEFKQALAFASRLLELDPWREKAHRQVMFLLDQSGQRCAALAQYETCRRVLAEELGVEPAPETIALYERIRHGKLDQAPKSKPDVTLPPFLHAAPVPPGPTAPFVAREGELAQLTGLLDLALAGQGRLVFVTGEAGCGKTALIQAFARRAQQKRANLAVAGGNCNAHTGLGDPYLPFREILALLTGDVEARWTVGAIDRQQARRLWAMLPHSVQALVEAGPDLIDIFIPGRALATRAAAFSTDSGQDGAGWLDRLERLVVQKEAGQARANLTQSDLFEQYAKALQALAQQTPLLLVLDDLQWADAGSISLLFHLGRRLEGSRILIVGIYRPSEVALGRDGQRHPLAAVISEFQRQFGNIRIALRQTEDRQFVEALIDTEPNRLGAAFREALYQQTRGHALFTVEMLHGLQERGDLVKDETGRWVEGPVVNWQHLPARVEGVIGQRIGRLAASQREVLKVASVEGEIFAAEVVARVQGVNEQELVRQLSSTLGQRHRLVQGQGSQHLYPGGQRLSFYRFRHILFQKYIYNSLDDVERVYLHEALGKTLERLYGEQTEAMAVQLARHFRAAGIADKAVDYLQQAAEKAVRSYAYQEAITLFNEALALLKSLPDSPEHIRQELSLQVALGNTLLTIRGFAVPEVKQVYDRARELCQQVGVIPQLFPVLHGLYRFYVARGELQTGWELAEQIMELTQQQTDPSLLLPAQLALALSFLFMGKFAPAQKHFAQGLAVYNSQYHHDYILDYGHDPVVACLVHAAWALWHLGYPDQALKKSNEALSLAEELAHPFSLTYTLCFAGALHQFRQEARTAQEQSVTLIALSSEQGFADWGAIGTIQRGWALAMQGQEKEGIAQMRWGLAGWHDSGAELLTPYFLALQAEACGQANQIEAGLNLLGEALAVAHKNGERFYEAELYRLTGELIRKLEGGRGRDESPEACFLKAIEIARQQSARSLELRAVMSLCRLWRPQGSPGQKAEARQMLAEIYSWFSEGFDTADLKEAKALLEELEGN